MKAAIYNVQESNFEQWIKVHLDCEEIALKGVVDIKEASSFDIILSLHDKTIDISELVISCDGNTNYKKVLGIIEDVPFWDGERPVVILVLYANKDLATKFVVSKDGIVSKDRQSLIYCNSADTVSKILLDITHIGNYSCMGIFEFGKHTSTCILNIPEGVISIGAYAFANNDIDEVIFPNSLRKLGSAAFSSTCISKLTIPEGVEEIPEMCFMYCMIEEIHLPNTLKAIRNRSLMFYGWVDELIIPEGVVEIESDALEGLNTISLPSTLIKLADDFYYEDLVDDGDEKPYIKVHEDNPKFYSKEGKIYERGQTEEYIPYRKNKYMTSIK